MPLLETTWYWLHKVPKSAPRTIFNKFSVFRGILVQVKVLLFLTKTTVWIFSNEVCLLWKGDQFLREKFLYLKQSGIGCKKFQRVHPKPFLKIFQFLEEIYYSSNFYLLWPNLLSEFSQMNRASSERVTNFSEKSFFTWSNLVVALKCSKWCMPNHFLQIFSF